MNHKTNQRSSLEKLRNKKRSRDELVVPWLQMPGEPDDSFSAFTEYRKIPPEDRSISELLKRPALLLMSQQYKSSWFYKKANTWAWVSRAEAFDNWSRYNHLTKQFGKYMQRLDAQAAVGEDLIKKAQKYLLGDDDIDVENMWMQMEPRDLISALKLGTQIERDAYKLQRESLVANESFIELDELSQAFKPGSVQEQMFEAVMRDDWDGLMAIMEKVVQSNRSPEDRAMPTKGNELTEGEREKVQLMAKRLLRGVLSAPDELLAELAQSTNGTNGTNGISMPN